MLLDTPAPMRGFTLIELIVTLAVAAILLTIAVPSFQTFIMNSRMASNANEMMATLAYARSEAVKRAANITVCASSNGATCTGNWQDGWVVLDADGEILRVQQALGGTTTLAGAGTLIFSANGRMTTPIARTCLDLDSGMTGIEGRKIRIEPSGRAGVMKEDSLCP